MSKKATKAAEGKKQSHKPNDKEVQQNTVNAASASKSEDNTADVTTDETLETEDKSVEILQKMQEAEEKSREWQDKYLRLSAEFDNFRKRTLKEKSDLLRTGNEELLKKLLPVIDDFERGIDTIDKSTDLEALRTGIHLIYNKFSDFIKQQGLKEIEAKEQVFDLDFHEAMTKIPAPTEDLKGKVVDVLEKGYVLNEKVVRYAKVIVGE